MDVCQLNHNIFKNRVLQKPKVKEHYVKKIILFKQTAKVVTALDKVWQKLLFRGGFCANPPKFVQRLVLIFNQQITLLSMCKTFKN